jgi:hypothetical protein
MTVDIGVVTLVGCQCHGGSSGSMGLVVKCLGQAWGVQQRGRGLFQAAASGVTAPMLRLAERG